MILAGVAGRALDRPEVRHILDDSDDGPVPLFVAADRAWVDSVDVTAGGTSANADSYIRHRTRQWVEQRFTPLDEMEHCTPGGAWPEAWQPGQKLDQAVDFGKGHFARQNLRTAA